MSKTDLIQNARRLREDDQSLLLLACSKLAGSRHQRELPARQFVSTQAGKTRIGESSGGKRFVVRYVFTDANVTPIRSKDRTAGDLGTQTWR